MTRVIVVGSGMAGLTAALAAAIEGADVTVLERSDRIGGTTALSGGSVWVPGNSFATGPAASKDAALSYLQSEAGAMLDKELAAFFIENAADTVAFLEEHTPVRFLPVRYPDYRPWVDGAVADGRTIQPDLFDSSVLGDAANQVRRREPHLPVLLSETMGGVDFSAGAVATIDDAAIEARLSAGMWARGLALVGAAVAGCLNAGVQFTLETHVVELLLDEGAVKGVITERDGQRVIERADGVVLASGGFESDRELVDNFLQMPGLRTAGQRYNTGDALRMSMSAGADLACLSNAWFTPVISRPDEMEDGTNVQRLSQYERARPGCIMVNREGSRFVDEARNYHDVGMAMSSFDSASFTRPNFTAWLIFDDNCRRGYPMVGLSPSEPDPDWLLRATTIPGLAELLGVDATALEQTVTTFNDGAKLGVDDAFDRGGSAYDQFIGEQSLDGPAATLGPLLRAPFYAVPITCGVLGTNGGARIDVDGRVRSARGGVVHGLFAAGNAAASSFGPLYPGAGATLGPAAVFGRRAGTSAAQGPPRP